MLRVSPAEFIEKYLRFNESKNYENAYANGLYQKAIILDDLGSYEKSLAIYYSILKIYEERKDDFSIATTLNAIGEALKRTDKVNEAMTTYHKALSIFSDLDNKVEMANCNFNIGDTYILLKDYNQALKYLQTALKFDIETNSQWGIAYDLEAIGKVYGLKKDHKEAINYHKRALTIRTQLGQKRELSLSHTQLGLNFIDIKNFDKAKTHLTEAIKITEEIKAKSELQNNYEAFSRLLAETDEYEKALEYKNMSAILKDSLFNETKSKQLQELQVKFETEKSQDAIASLQKDAEIKDLLLERQQTIRNLAIGLAIVILFCGYYLFLRYQNYRYEYLKFV